MPGTKFVRATLLATVEGNYNRRIDELKNRLREEEDGTAREQRTAEWRRVAEERVRDLAANLPVVGDDDLSGWKIPYRPDRDNSYTISSLKREIYTAEKNRDKALGYVHALVAVDKDLNGSEVVEVTAVDLKRIGYGV